MQLNDLTVLFLTIQLKFVTRIINIKHSIQLTDWTLSVATTPNQSERRSDGTEGTLYITKACALDSHHQIV